MWRDARWAAVPAAAVDGGDAAHDPGRTLRYGLGLAARRTPCGTAWGHTGDLLGYITAVQSARDARRQAVVNSEPFTPDAEAAGRRLIDAAFCRRAAGGRGARSG